MAGQAPTVSVLFVCLGNICRSTMVEGVFRSLTRSNPRIGTVDSAGTGAYHSLDPPDPRTMATLRKHGIRDYEHAARQVTPEDFREFDYVLAMDASNLRDLRRLQQRVDDRKGVEKSKAKVRLLGEFGGRGGAEEVVDPYYGSNDGFGEVYGQVVRLSKGFLEEVVDREGRDQ